MLALLILVGVIWPGSPAIALGPFDEFVVDVDTPYHHISVVDIDDFAGVAFRSLRGKRDHQIPALSQPGRLYGLLSPGAFWRNPEIERALFIGAGGGVGPRAFHMHNPEMAIDVVDIDPKVLELAHTYFFLDDSPEIKTIAEDGRMFVRRVQSKYDCVILDAFSAGGAYPFTW